MNAHRLSEQIESLKNEIALYQSNYLNALHLHKDFDTLKAIKLTIRNFSNKLKDLSSENNKL